MIDAAAIPVIEGDMDALIQHATSISSVGAAVTDTGAQVHSTWQELGAVYHAPEAAQLLAATLPVQHVAAAIGEDIQTVGAVLIRYANEVRDIQARLKALSAQAVQFQADMDFIGGPSVDQVYVDQNNDLVSAVNTAMADFDDAQRRCATAINALYRTGQAYRAPDDNGQVDPGEYGATAAQLDSLAAVGLPWGGSEPPAPPAEPVSVADRAHGILDLIGLVPVIGEPVDGINALWYAYDGDYISSGLSAAAMVPIIGWGASGGKALSRAARATAKATREVPARRFVTTPRGTTFEIPPGWVTDPAKNGKGIVLQRPGAVGNADSIRIMEPTPLYPHGYYRYYNHNGQPLDVAGKPGANAETHFPEEYVGPTEGWPG